MEADCLNGFFFSAGGGLLFLSPSCIPPRRAALFYERHNMKNLILLLSLSLPVFATDLPKEIPTIRKAAERNGIKYGSDDWYLLLAIRLAENGRPGLEFGIMNPKAKDLDLQAAWCACTIMNQHKRYGSMLVTEDFIKSLGLRYCPPKAHKLNKNWQGNVLKLYRGLNK